MWEAAKLAYSFNTLCWLNGPINVTSGYEKIIHLKRRVYLHD